MSNPRQDLIDASAVLEAIRPSFNNAEDTTNETDQPIRDAWDVARDRFRDACRRWLESVKS